MREAPAMGQAKSRLKRMQSEQPWCIYCGGATLGTSADHMPPVAVFDLGQRYGDMVYLACKACHTGTRVLDQVVGFLARAYPDPVTPAAKAEVIKIVDSIKNNFPGLLEEMEPSIVQLAQARSAPVPFGPDDGPLNVGEKLHSLVTRFAARAAIALHYELCRKILPEGGGVFVNWFTNDAFIKGTFPVDFAERLGPSQTLRQGSMSLEGQFRYQSGATPDGHMSAHLMTFRLSFGVQAFAARNIDDLAPAVPTATRNRVFRPGFLQP
jgi:hypothetical protein